MTANSWLAPDLYSCDVHQIARWLNDIPAGKTEIINNLIVFSDENRRGFEIEKRRAKKLLSLYDAAHWLANRAPKKFST